MFFSSRSFRFSSSVALLLAGAGLLSSCGGGGNSGPVQPTPTATSVAASCDATTFSPNYILSNTGTSDNGQGASFTHWTHFPLKIYLPSVDAATRANTLAGFDQLVAATNGRVSYKLVSSATGADVSVSFLPLATTSDILGLTTVNYIVESTQIVSVQMQLFVQNADGSVNTAGNADGTTQTIAAHEFGHALGIGPHSLDDNDLMYYAIHNTSGPEQVTTRDLDTLKTIYCNNFPTGQALLRGGTLASKTYQ